MSRSIASTNASYTFVVSTARVLTANFIVTGSNNVQVTVWLGPLSPLGPSPGGTVQGAGTYTIGSQVTLVASPSPGYRLSSWMATDGSIIGAPALDTLTFTASTSRTVVANFASTDPRFGSLVVAVVGLYTNGAANIAVTGPNGYSTVVNYTGMLTGLTPGLYSLTPTLNLNFAGKVYNPNVQSANFTVPANSVFYYSMCYF